MKKRILRSSALAGLLSLSLLFPNFKKGDLPDVTKPYLGEYECKEVKLGEQDFLKLFSYIRLELKKEGKFSLCYKERGGKKKEIEGEYVYDPQQQTLNFLYEGIQREFPLKEGKLSVFLPVNEKNLLLIFEQK